MTDTVVNDPAQLIANTAPPGGGNLATPPPAPAPAPEPLVATPAPSTPAPVAAPAANGAFTYEPTGDLALDMSLEFFGNLGIAPDSAEMVEASKGNFQYLDAKLAAMGDKAKGYERHLSLGKEAYTRIEARDKAAFDAILTSVHETVGGKEAWEATSAYAKQHMKPEMLEQARAVISTGGLAAQAMAFFLHNQVLQAQGTSVPGRPAVDTGAAATAAVVSSAPLNPQQFGIEYKKGLAKYGMGFDKTPEYQALLARRSN